MRDPLQQWTGDQAEPMKKVHTNVCPIRPCFKVTVTFVSR